jgi:hypothetical protein
MDKPCTWIDAASAVDIPGADILDHGICKRPAEARQELINNHLAKDTNYLLERQRQADAQAWAQTRESINQPIPPADYTLQPPPGGL